VQLTLAFGERYVEAFLAIRRAFDQKLQTKCGLS